MAATLERAFAADRGFDVPTVVLTTTELADIAEAADKVARQAPFAVGAHYVSILAEAPSAEAVATFTAREAPGERAVVRGRTVHLMLDAPERYHSSKLPPRVEKDLGVGTNRNVSVVRDLAQRWT